MYKFKLRKEDAGSARFAAALAVFLTFLFQLVFAAGSARFFFGYKGKFLQFCDDKSVNSWIAMATIVMGMVASVLFFNKKRSARIIEEYDHKIGHVFAFKNILLLLVIVFTPLVVGIYLLNHSEYEMKLNGR